MTFHKHVPARASWPLALVFVGGCVRSQAPASPGTTAPPPPSNVSVPRPIDVSLFTDAFDRQALLPDYTVSSPQTMVITQDQGTLHIHTLVPAEFAGAHLIVPTPFVPSANTPVVAQARIRLHGVANNEGGVARIQLVDGETWINFGMLAPTGVVYQRQQGHGTLVEIPIPGHGVDDRWHEYKIECDGQQARLVLDGEQVATVPIAMQQAYVWLQAHTHYQRPGTVHGEFDDFRVTSR